MNFGVALVVVVALGNFTITSAAQIPREGHAAIPREQLFQREKGIKLSPENINSDKFLEQKNIPVQPWNPPNKDVEERYFTQKAMHDFDGGLLEARGFTDTDIIMMNRWSGLEDTDNLWEADMILSPKQRAMYTKQGKIFGNANRVMPEFSQSWPDGEIHYFFENDESEGLFGDLQMAMNVWEYALGCIKFKLTDVKTLWQTTTKKPEPAHPEYEDHAEATASPREVSATSLNLNSSSGGGDGDHQPPPVNFSGTSHLLRVTAGDGCYASVGWRPWSRLVISQRCTLGVIVHLLGHVLGLPHEHSRPDRVHHVDIHAQNVRSRDFLFLNTAEGGGARCSNSSHGWYDIRSVMHLDPFGLSANNLSSLTAKRFTDTAYVGATWRRPSYNDILRLRAAYACPRQTSSGCEKAPACVGRLERDCSCTPTDGCTVHPPPGGCSVDLALSAPEAPPQQLVPGPVRRRGRVCAWRLRAGAACGRVRMTLRLMMEVEAHVAATALGCAPLRMELLDWDPLEGGRNTSSSVCLSDLTRWQPGGAGSWLATKEIISTSDQLRIVVKRYPVNDPALDRVLKSFEARLETVIDKYCHCKLAG